MPLTPAEANFIAIHKLGCRYGHTIGGAAYGFIDILGDGRDGGNVTPMDIFRWTVNPDQPAYEPRWHDRLWNTCGTIVGLSGAGNVMLVTLASPTAERYLFPSPAARGDGYSFRKCNRLPPNAQILANIPYGAGHAAPEQADIVAVANGADVDLKTVEQLYDSILVGIKTLVKTALA